MAASIRERGATLAGNYVVVKLGQGRFGVPGRIDLVVKAAVRLHPEEDMLMIDFGTLEDWEDAAEEETEASGGDDERS